MEHYTACQSDFRETWTIKLRLLPDPLCKHGSPNFYQNGMSNIDDQTSCLTDLSNREHQAANLTDLDDKDHQSACLTDLDNLLTKLG